MYIFTHSLTQNTKHFFYVIGPREKKFVNACNVCGAAAAVQRTHMHTNTLDPSHTHTQEERRRHRLYVQNTAGYAFRGAWESQAKKDHKQIICMHGLTAADHPIRSARIRFEGTKCLS